MNRTHRVSQRHQVNRFHRALQPQRASPPAPLRMERGVITEIPLHVLQMFSSPSPFISRPKGVTSHTTPLSIRRGAGGEASVISVCRRPSVSSKRCAKGSVKSVSSVREKTPQRFSSILSLTVGAFYFSQIYTDEQNTQRPTETLSQPITQNVTATESLTPSPSPNGEGSEYRDTPVCPPYDSYVFSSCQQASRGNLTYYSPLHSERGWG